MNQEEKKRYIWKGLTLFAAISGSILFFFVLFRLKNLFHGFQTLLHILAPIIYGLVLAYLLAPIYNKIEKRIEPVLKKKIGKTKGKAFAKASSTLITLVFMIAVLTGFFWMVVPQVYKSILGIVDLVPESVNQVYAWLDTTFKNNPQVSEVLSNYYTEFSKQIEQWLKTSLVPNLTAIQTFVSNVSLGLYRVFSFLKNFLIGIIVAVYVLNCKTVFASQAKKIIYSIFNEKWGSAIIHESFWWVYYWQIDRFFNYWHYLLSMSNINAYALYDADKCDYRNYKYYSIFWAVYWCNSKFYFVAVSFTNTKFILYSVYFCFATI